MRLIPALLVTCALVPACTPSATPEPRSSGSPAASSPSTASPGRPAAPVLAVIHGDRLALYRVVPGRHAVRLLRELPPPVAGYGVYDVSLSAGPDPVVCAVWRKGDEHALACYDPATGTPHIVPTPGGAPWIVSVSYSGRSVAWASGTGEFGALREDPDIYVAHVSGAAVRDAVAIPARPTSDDGTDVNGIAWQRDDTLVVSVGTTVMVDTVDESNVRRLWLVVAPLAAARTEGWLRGRRVGRPNRGSDVYDFVRSSTPDAHLLAVEGHARAVLVDLTGGTVREVIATAQPDRTVSSVTGGDRGVAYVTEGDGERSRAYWREPGEARGTPLTGLPASWDEVIAQP